MTVTPSQLSEWLQTEEGERLEFKAARNNFDTENLVKYCVALANERGGNLILGVSDSKPRQIVGSQACQNLAALKYDIYQKLHIRVEAEAIQTPARVVVFTIPSRPVGLPLAYKGTCWMRSGESLVPMTPDYMRQIFAEATPDFSAKICPEATWNDLDAKAIEEFRTRWLRKSKNENLRAMSHERLLADAELLYPEGFTYAALILFGTRYALGRLLGQAEVIFEYRSNDAPGPANQRLEYRQGYFLHADEIWHNINLRNDLQHFQMGFSVYAILTFNETACREAILNAISHRDYQSGGSIFIRQYPRRLEIVSPGGFPSGITPQNIILAQLPRNRRLAETFARCGLVERAGQGADLMFSTSVTESKPLPDFTGTDAYQVALTLHCEVQDPDFLRFLEKVGQDRLSKFTAQDFLILDLVNREKKIPIELKPRVPFLLEQGIIEKAGGWHYLLAQQFYDFVDKRGVYTRKRGLARQANKALLYQHIVENREIGSKLHELMDVLPALSEDQVKKLLQELKRENLIFFAGKTNAGHWYPMSAK